MLLLNVNSLCLVLRKRRAEAAKARKAKILAQVKFFIIWVSPLNVEASLFFFMGIYCFWIQSISITFLFPHILTLSLIRITRSINRIWRSAGLIFIFTIQSFDLSIWMFVHRCPRCRRTLLARTRLSWTGSRGRATPRWRTPRLFIGLNSIWLTEIDR